MSAFRRGFRNRNPLVLVVAAVLLVPALLGFQWLFTSGAWTVVPLDAALRNPEDSFTYISWMVGKAQQDEPATPGLYLLGGSSARESIVSGDALAAEIAELGGPRVAAYDLGSINQNFAESLTVVDSVPDTPAWLLVGINLGRFTATEEQNAAQAEGREFLLESGAVQLFVSSEWGLEKYQYTILPGIWAYITDWARKHGGKLLEGDAPSTDYELHRYSAKTRRSDGQKKRLVTKWNTSRKPVFEQNLDANLQMLEALLAAGPRARREGRAAGAAAQRGDRRRQLRRVAAAVPGAGRGARARVRSAVHRPQPDARHPQPRLPGPLASHRARARHLATCTGEGACPAPPRRLWRE